MSQFHTSGLLNKKTISLFIFLIVSFLFSIKYLSRITPYSGVISFTITLSYWLIWKYRNALLPNKPVSQKITLIAIFGFIAASFLILKKIPAESLNVDRWSVITTYWDCYFKGEYVYFAKSNVGNYPGPMPFYFILALPFYLIGELGYFSILGVLLFYLLIEKTIINRTAKSILVFLLLINLPYLWEVVCRSNILLNGTLVLGVLIFFLSQKELKPKNIIVLGILIGLVISTRNVFVIPFIIAFVYALKRKKINLLQTAFIGLITVLTFCITFLPFVWNHMVDFKVMNPFIIQSSVLVPFEYTVLFILTSFVAGLFVKKTDDVYFYSGLILFGSIVTYFIYWIVRIGLEKTFTESGADISYFILCLPFSLYHLLKENDNTI